MKSATLTSAKPVFHNPAHLSTFWMSDSTSRLISKELHDLEALRGCIRLVKHPKCRPSAAAFH